VQLARPVESSISEEEQVVDHQGGQRAHNQRILLSNSWGSDGVQDEQAHLEHLLLPENGFGSLFSVGVGGQESEVVGQVELQKLNVLFILANRLELRLEVINSLNLHYFLGNFS
jgi:hypothetical protein